MTVVADSGAIYALIDGSDLWHERVTTWWSSTAEEILLPVSILAEVTHLLQQRIGPMAEEAFVRAIADAEFLVEPLLDEDMSQIADIMRTYRDFPLGFVDASVIAMTERLETRSVLTTDRRHFSAVRPAHVRTLQLLP